MSKLARLLRRSLTSESNDASIGSKLLYVAGLVIFVISTLRMASLGLTEGQLLFGLLLVICVTMQMILGGLLLEMGGRLPQAEKDRR